MSKAIGKMLTDSFEVKGIWALEESDLENGIDGILRYSPKEIVLELIGSFDNVFSYFNIKDRTQLTIYGFSENAERFTLLGCIPKEAYKNAPGFDTCTYSVNRFYAGTNYIKNEEEPLLTEAAFSFTNIDIWMDFSVLRYFSDEEYRKAGCMVEIDSQQCRKNKVEISSIGMILSEEFRYSIKYPSDYFLSETAKITINRFYSFLPQTKELMSPQAMLTNIQLIRRLLAFLLGKEMYFTYIEFHLPDKIETYFEEETYVLEEHCRMFFKQVGDITKAKHLSQQDFSILLKRSDIKDNLEHILNTWFVEQEKLGECVNAYISDLYLPAYIENKFLNVVRGIETYHRFFIENGEENEAEDLAVKPNLEEDYHKILAYINTNISAENRDYFLARINYVDEMNLRKRLKSLLLLTPSALYTRLFGNMTSHQQKKIIAQVIDTRNYYTHRDEKKNYKNVLDSGFELMRLTNKLSILLQYFCLTQIGVDSGVAVQRLIAIANYSAL